METNHRKAIVAVSVVVALLIAGYYVARSTLDVPHEDPDDGFGSLQPLSPPSLNPEAEDRLLPNAGPGREDLGGSPTPNPHGATDPSRQTRSNRTGRQSPDDDAQRRAGPSQDEYRERYESALNELTAPWSRPEPYDLGWELVDGEASAHYAEAFASCDLQNIESEVFQLMVDTMMGLVPALQADVTAPPSCVEAGYPETHRSPVLVSLGETDCALIVACRPGFDSLNAGSRAAELTNFDMGEELGLIPFLTMPKLLLLDTYLRSDRGVLAMMDAGLVALRISHDLRRRTTLIQSLVSGVLETLSINYLTAVLFREGPGMPAEELELLRRELVWLNDSRATWSEVWLREWVWSIPFTVEGLDTDGIWTGLANDGSRICSESFDATVCSEAAALHTAVLDTLGNALDGSFFDLQNALEPLVPEYTQNPFLAVDSVSPFLRYAQRFMSGEAHWRLFALSTADLLHTKFENTTAGDVEQLHPLVPMDMTVDPFTRQPFEFGLDAGGNLAIRSPFCYQPPTEAELFEEFCSDPGDVRRQLEIVRFVSP